MSDGADYAAAYWSQTAVRAYDQFHLALAALVERAPAVAAVTMDAISASKGVFVMRPTATVGAYPATIEPVVELCYDLARGFQSSVTLIAGVAPHALAILERNLVSAKDGGPLAGAADSFFWGAIAQAPQTAGALGRGRQP